MKKEIVAQFSIFPIGGKEEVSKDVANVLKIIKESGLSYELNAMSTVIEGSYEEITELAGNCLKSMKENNNRVYLSMTMDYRKDRENAISGKVNAVKDVLKEDVNSKS